MKFIAKTSGGFMITEKKISLRPILESSEGIHLTAYLVNRGSVTDLKGQIRETLTEANEYLHSVQSADEKKKFLEPIEGLLKDTRLFSGIKGNIGIFRTMDAFRILSLPIEFERQCYVASSFHVKPLLRWIQIDREFLLLGIDKESAHLYQGNLGSLQKMGSIGVASRQGEPFVWLNEWLNQVTFRSSPRLFVAGEKEDIARVYKNLSYRNIEKKPVALSFGEHNVGEICLNIRNILKIEAKKSLEQSLLEFRFAEEINLAKKNIFQIAKAAVQGRIRKLIIADGMNIFGKIDKKTGGLAIHPAHLDHEDDDLLDDLAQTVLASGGEVLVASKEEIPKGRPILAILEPHGTELERSEDFQAYKALRERIPI